MPRLPLVALLPTVGLSALALGPPAGSGVSAVSSLEATRTIRYAGVTVAVPAGWPVVDFTHDPVGCVRYDQHAVYLGAPKVSDCPAHLVGATQTVQVAFAPAQAGPVARTAQGLVVIRSGAAGAPGTVEVPGDAGHAAVMVSDGGSDATTKAIVDSVRHVGPASRAASTAVSTDSSTASPAAAVTATVTAAAGYTTGEGFDTCTAPSAAQLQVWRASPYRSVGVYVGGVNRACAQANLTASWVTQVTGAGWTLIPTYVGLQAPCWSASGSKMSTTSAATQGTAAADDAVTKMTALGLGPGNPVYDDMEAYSTTNTSCVQAVEAFQNAWTQELHLRGYVSGFYSSAASGITNMVQKASDPTYHLPDDLWIAHWDGNNTTSDSYVPAGMWANHQRIKQYRGGHNETYAGVTLNIDNDAVDGAVGTPAQAARVPSDVNGDGRSDLCVFLGENGYPTSSGALELHCLNGGSLFASRLYDVKTPYSYINTHYQLPLALDADGDGRTDACLLSGINGGGTPSGKLEVHCAAARSGFGTATLSAVTPWARTSTHIAYPVALDVNGDGFTDLCKLSGIDGHPTASGHLELDCLDGSSGYATAFLHVVTPLPYISTWAQLPMGLDVDGDAKTDLCLLSGINGYASSSGRLQETCLTAASGFTGSAVVEPTADGYLDTRTSYPIALDVNGDGRTDLCELTGLNGSTTTSGKLQAHCLNGATKLSTLLLNAVTAYGYQRTAATAFMADGPVDVDITPPVPYALPVPSYALTDHLVFPIGATDAQSGVASYDVRYRAAPYNKGFSGYVYPSYLHAVTAKRVGITASRGTTVCISVRARDRVFNLSGWSSERCTAVPLDDRNLTASSGWTRGSGSAFYAGTLSRAVSSGQSLVLTGVAARRLSLIATTCPTCGSVGVYLNGSLLRTITLTSSSYENQRVLFVYTFSSVVTGTVAIRTLSGRVVYVDGLVVSKL